MSTLALGGEVNFISGFNVFASSRTTSIQSQAASDSLVYTITDGATALAASVTTVAAALFAIQF